MTDDRWLNAVEMLNDTNIAYTPLTPAQKKAEMDKVIKGLKDLPFGYGTGMGSHGTIQEVFGTGGKGGGV